MLLEFSVKNYLSFKDKVTLSLLGNEDVMGHEDDNTFYDGGTLILKSVVIYGTKESGKSNLIKAMQFMRHFVLNSAVGEQSEAEIDVDNFKLAIEMAHQPSQFEITFVHEDRYYRYGFELDSRNICQEWLYQQQKRLFHRKNQSVKFDESFTEGQLFLGDSEEEYQGLKLVRETALLLSTAARFDCKISQKLIHWFENQFNISLVDGENFLQQLTDAVEHGKIFVIDELDLKLPILVEDLILNMMNLEYVSPESANLRGSAQLILNLVGTEGLKLSLSSVILESILNVFNSQWENPDNAQLIFSLHDSSLLTSQNFRRDQIWFTEKDRHGATDLYSALEIDDSDEYYEETEYFEVRDKYNPTMIEVGEVCRKKRKKYFEGRYGSIPFTGNLSIFKDSDDVDDENQYDENQYDEDE